MAPELPPSRFFDLPDKFLRASPVKLPADEWDRRITSMERDSSNLSPVDFDTGELLEHFSKEADLPLHTPAGVCGGGSAEEGLSNTPKTPVDRSQVVELEIYPAYARLRVRHTRVCGEFDRWDAAPKHRAKRGRIKEFSEKSRLRLQLLAANLGEVTKPDLMVTLTYPGEWESVTSNHFCTCEAREGSSDVSCVCELGPSGKVCKRHLDLFQKRVERYLDRFGLTEWGCLWFLEFQTRGAPHFHLIFFGLTGVRSRFPLDLLKKWCSRNWSEIVGHADPHEYQKHLNAGTRVEFCKKPHFGYALKYAAKMEQKNVPPEFANIGRFWSCWNNPVKKPVLRAIIPTKKTFETISKELHKIIKVHSRGFALKVVERLWDAFEDKSECSLLLYGKAVADYLLSYGKPKPLPLHWSCG